MAFIAAREQELQPDLRIVRIDETGLHAIRSAQREAVVVRCGVLVSLKHRCWWLAIALVEAEPSGWCAEIDVVDVVGKLEARVVPDARQQRVVLADHTVECQVPRLWRQRREIERSTSGGVSPPAVVQVVGAMPEMYQCQQRSCCAHRPLYFLCPTDQAHGSLAVMPLRLVGCSVLQGRRKRSACRRIRAYVRYLRAAVHRCAPVLIEERTGRIPRRTHAGCLLHSADRDSFQEQNSHLHTT